jgi:hypothetical protein
LGKLFSFTWTFIIKLSIFPKFFVQNRHFNLVILPISLILDHKFYIQIGKTMRKSRTLKPFSSLSKSGKRASALAIRRSAQPQAILMAARQIAKRQGNHDKAFLMWEMDKDPLLSSQLRQLFNFKMSKLSAPEALCFILQNNVSRSSYKGFRELVKEHGANLLPSWDLIQVNIKSK